VVTSRSVDDPKHSIRHDRTCYERPNECVQMTRGLAYPAAAHENAKSCERRWRPTKSA
jgi:hypothetical protein